METDILVIGGGIIGRFVKVIMPDVLILERGAKLDTITVELLGANMSRVDVPELKCLAGFQKALIDGEHPTMDKIKQYKAIKTGEATVDYGDIKQFLPLQPVHFVMKPEVDILYNTEVVKINVADRVATVKFSDGAIAGIKYGCIISTIPMSKLIGLIDIFEGTNISEVVSLPRRTIYFKEEALPNPIIDDNILMVDFSTEVDSIFYRKQYCGKRMSKESFFRFEGARALYPGKILPSPKAEEIAQDLQQYSVYCYGRYARWRNKEHLHETFKNLRRFKERRGQIGYS